MSREAVSYRLRSIVTIVFVLLFIVVAATLQYLNAIGESQAKHYTMLSDLGQLEDASLNLKARGEYYIANAPRDYESYFRDVAVFNQQMQSDIHSFDNKLKRVATDYQQQQLTHGLQGKLFRENWQELAAEIKLSETHWAKFQQGLNQALGTDKNEPRLEWGAQYIVENADSLTSKLQNMIGLYRELIHLTDQNSRQLAFWASLITALGMLLALVLVQWLVWRVGRTAAASHRVANGDFGYQLADKRKDEIGLMTSAFNSLSGRIGFILNLLTKLNSSRQPGDALAAFWNDSQSYLDADWMGLLIQDKQGQKLVLTHQQSDTQVSTWRHRIVNLDSGSKLEQDIAECIKQKKSLWVEDVRAKNTDISGALFFRELIQKTMLRSFVVMPLLNDDHSWKAALVVGKGVHKQFNEEQLELLQNLSPIIGSIFANATSNKRVNLVSQKAS
ncbi:HAMP domain-containing protein [Agaribacterium haliotis]|uniref:HAMP domain-containing protein n=1 Tax=Agaribacterium haliotis TaxID=2013869 RepID=UPI000BB57CDB|nr:HAMP domain-containing protein [Agaribacterium haliotis]